MRSNLGGRCKFCWFEHVVPLLFLEVNIGISRAVLMKPTRKVCVLTVRFPLWFFPNAIKTYFFYLRLKK